jgi:hypothetical protein
VIEDLRKLWAVGVFVLRVSFQEDAKKHDAHSGSALSATLKF